MGQDSGGAPPATATGKRSALSADEVRAFTDRAPRCKVSLHVVGSVVDAAHAPGLDGELINVSSSGMLVASTQPLAIGAVVDF